MQQDRRRHPRQPITLPVYVGLNSPCSGGILHDMSAGGMALDIIVGPRPATDNVILDLNVPGADEHLEVQGRITWTKEPENRVGFEFVNLTGNPHQQIERWLSANEAPPQKPDTSEWVDYQRPLHYPDRNPEIITAKNPNLRDTSGVDHAGRSSAKFTKPPEAAIPLKSDGAKVVPPRLDVNGLIQGLSRYDASVPYPVRRIEKIAELTASRTDVTEAGQVGTKATVAKRADVVIPGPRLGSGRIEPSTSSRPAAQASETSRNSVGTPSHGKSFVRDINKSLAIKPVAAEVEQKVLTADGIRNGLSSPGSLPPLERMAKPAPLHRTDTTETNAGVPDGGVRVVIPSSSLPSEKKGTATTGSHMLASDAHRSTTLASDHDDEPLRALRSSFAQFEAAAYPPSEEEVSDWGILRPWIMAAVIILLLTLSLGAARWIYISPVFDKFASAPTIRQLVAGLFGTESETKGVVHDENLNGAAKVPPSRPEKRKRKSNEIRGTGSNARRSVAAPGLETQNRRQGLPQGSAAVKEPSDLTAGSSGFVAHPISESQTEAPVGAEVGHVSLLPAAELPERIILPQYPSVALEKNLQGRVILKALIDKDGILQNIRLIGAPSVLSSAALEAVKKWRYQPRMENGRPVEMETQITMDFEK
jgi:TonB family protein